ncbi:18762_t:CDS:2 [Gigaspora rosea]|nr:18762_t:CDS:2 [Gigaspora rosea]
MNIRRSDRYDEGNYNNKKNPDAPITSLILPPRKKETVQLPPREASIITPSSSIITLLNAAEISSD